MNSGGGFVRDNGGKPSHFQWLRPGIWLIRPPFQVFECTRHFGSMATPRHSATSRKADYPISQLVYPTSGVCVFFQASHVLFGSKTKQVRQQRGDRSSPASTGSSLSVRICPPGPLQTLKTLTQHNRLVLGLINRVNRHVQGSSSDPIGQQQW